MVSVSGAAVEIPDRAVDHWANLTAPTDKGGLQVDTWYTNDTGFVVQVGLYFGTATAAVAGLQLSPDGGTTPYVFTKASIDGVAQDTGFCFLCPPGWSYRVTSVSMQTPKGHQWLPMVVSS